MSTEIIIDGPVSDGVPLPFQVVIQPTLTFFKPIQASAASVDGYLTAEQAAAYVGVSTETVRRLLPQTGDNLYCGHCDRLPIYPRRSGRVPSKPHYAIMSAYSINRHSGAFTAPFNQILNEPRVYTFKDTAIPLPNSDTLIPFSL
jgi:hypothetical protein